MKKILLLLIWVASLGVYERVSAQCVISDLKVFPHSIDYSTGEVVFDLSWTQDINNGSKFSYIHIWTQADYHTPTVNWVNMYHNPTAYPKAADLVNALATIVIENNSADIPVIGTVYHPDPSYALPQQSGLSVVKIHLNNTLIERMTVKNIKVFLPLPITVGAEQMLMFDVWASQAANGKNVHCVSQGNGLVINEITVHGNILCNVPRQFSLIIINNDPYALTVTYKVFLDYANPEILDPTDTLVFSSSSITIPPNSTYTSGPQDYPTSIYSAERPLIAEITSSGSPNTILVALQNSCGPLAVKFSSFKAIQLKDRITLSWQTASEQNNSGFEIQRKLSGADYRAIGFVPSKTTTGNSNLLLDYNYDDMDNLSRTGQLFYRIRQVDLDGKSSFSEVRLLNNHSEKIEILIYPNPSRGSARVILPTGIGAVDITLNNSEGKAIRKWDRVVDQLQLNQLTPDIYLLRIIVKETGAVQAYKIIVL